MNTTENQKKQYKYLIEMQNLHDELKMTRKEFEEITDPYMHIHTGSIFSYEELEDEGEEDSDAFIAVMMDEMGDIVEWEA